MWSQSIWAVADHAEMRRYAGMQRVEQVLLSVGIRLGDLWIAPIQMPRLLAGARLLETAESTAQKSSAQFQQAVSRVAEGWRATGHTDQRHVLALAHTLGAWRVALEEDRPSAQALIVASLGKPETFFHEVRRGRPDYDRFQ